MYCQTLVPSRLHLGTLVFSKVIQQKVYDQQLFLKHNLTGEVEKKSPRTIWPYQSKSSGLIICVILLLMIALSTIWTMVDRSV